MTQKKLGGEKERESQEPQVGAFFKNTSQLFCRVSLNLDLSNVSSWFDAGYIWLKFVELVANVKN
jgi:hypothetical protein